MAHRVGNITPRALMVGDGPLLAPTTSLALACERFGGYLRVAVKQAAFLL